MSVHYKFKSALEYDTVTFDGLHISVKDLKNAIIQQKRIGKNTDFDLQVTNAQTKEVYEDEEALIPKNTSLLIARIPVIPSNKSKSWEGYGNDNAPITRTDEGGPIAKAVDLSSLDASEDDKIRAMMSQSTQDYDPSNYQKIRGANQVGTVPPNYRCYKCHQTGHWIKDCPLSQGSEPLEIKKSTGIPRSFMVPVEGPQVQGAMMTPNGSYAVPVLDHQTYTQKQQPAPAPVQEDQPEIPEDLICSICSGLLTDAVMIPCCGNSFCDECIRSCLLESEDHECPDCHERDISPGTLIPNRYLRNSVANFKNTTGYVKKPTYKPHITQQTQPAQNEKDIKEDVPKNLSKETDSIDSLKSELVEKAVISEADSTEPPKNPNVDFSKDIDPNEASKESPSKSSVSEGPPGVSPRREKSPKRQSTRRGSHSSQSNGRSRRNSKDVSPRQHHSRRSPTYEPMSRIEERPGTPTVDEPGGSNVSSNVYPPTSGPYPSAPPPGILPPMIGMPPPHMQGPPPNYPPGQPPPFSSQGPPPNFRLPPPGANNSAPYIPGPYNAPPRPIFDPSRPPLQGPPPNYSNYPPRSRNREYRDSSRMRTRTPPGIIDDPLEAFNRMLREKDERDRRAKQKKGRSYSRSSSRSYSRSPKRPRSRSPRRRNSRSRSRSFSISRSRSRSFSPSPRNSPYRDYSPRNSSPRRRPASRFRSPARSPPPRYRYKDGPINDRNRDRDFDRPPQRDRDRGFSRDRDYNYFERDRGGPRWGGGPPSRPPPMQDNYYPPDVHPLQPPPPSNRYPPRDNYQPPPFNKNESSHHMPPLLPPPNLHGPPQRRFDDIAPPGTDQPPIPGEELPPRYDDRYGYQDTANKEQFNNDRDLRNKEEEKRNVDNKPIRDDDKSRRFDRYSRSPTRGFKSPRKSRERVDSPDKQKRRKREHSEERERDRREDRHEKKRETSDDEKSKRSKDKKKKREKRELEKKKRKEKKERKEQDKAKKEDKDKKRDKDDVGIMENNAEKYLGDKDRQEKKEEKIISKTPDKPQELIKYERTEQIEETPDLYDDVLSDGVDKSIMKNYGKLEAIVEKENEKTPEIKKREEHEEEFKEDNEYPPESETSKDEDVLDIHANEAELKAELDKTEVLAPLPEKSKWEMDDEVTLVSVEIQKEGKQDRNGKVTNEVLKRAENAIFAKAINAIRPIEIKKISMDRAKLYSGEKEKDRKIDEQDIRNIQVTISTSPFEEDIHPPGTETGVKVESEIQKPPPRLSVKDRLGVKVDDLDRIVKVAYERNLSRSLSPLSKRAREERIHLDRRIDLDDRRRDDRGRHERDRYHRNYRNLDRNEFRRREEYLRRERERREEQQRREERRERSRSQKDESKHKRSRSRSESKEHKHRKKDKKQRREKSKKHKRDDKDDSKSKEETKSEKREGSVKPKSATDRRKATLDEASFEPDYDLDTESEKEGKISPKEVVVDEEKKRFKVEEKEQKESSSSDSSESSSEDDRKRKKHRKHKKKKSRKDSSSSSSSSDTDSSEEERERKRKKHKKKQKKRKKSKHK